MTRWREGDTGVGLMHCMSRWKRMKAEAREEGKESYMPTDR